MNAYVASIHELANVMLLDIRKTFLEIHPCFGDGRKATSMSISNDTLTRLEATLSALKQEKKDRLQKVYIYFSQAVNYLFIGLLLSLKVSVVNLNLIVRSCWQRFSGIINFFL